MGERRGRGTRPRHAPAAHPVAHPGPRPNRRRTRRPEHGRSRDPRPLPDAGQSRHGRPVRDRRPPRLCERAPPPAAADPAPPRLEPARRRVAPEPGRCPTPSSGTLSTPSTTPGPPRPAAQGTAVPAAPSNRTAPDKAPGPSAPATTESVAVTDTPTLVAPLRLF